MPKGKYKRPSVDDRFQAMIDKQESGCWLWTGCVVSRYGGFQVSGRLVKAHRYMWQITFGEIPAGLCVCHKCDVPLCVNPDHLFLGTNKDNVDDRERKGRGNPASGERNGHAKLTNEQVREMRKIRSSSGTSYRKLGHLFGVSTMQAYAAVNGRSYKDA